MGRPARHLVDGICTGLSVHWAAVDLEISQPRACVHRPVSSNCSNVITCQLLSPPPSMHIPRNAYCICKMSTRNKVTSNKMCAKLKKANLYDSNNAEYYYKNQKCAPGIWLFILIRRILLKKYNATMLKHHHLSLLSRTGTPRETFHSCNRTGAKESE